MKKSYLILAMLSLFALYSCTQEETKTSSSKAKISFSLSSADITNGRKESGDIQNVIAAMISVVTPTGENVMSYQRVNLIAFGDSFVTEPVEFEAGHYILTDFFLVGDSSEVLYATPHKGSFLGTLPRQPLDRNFSVAWGKTSTMDMEVVEVEGYSPEDFGYKSFSVTALKFFALTVKIEKNGTLAFTKAEATLLHGTDTIAKYNVGPAPTFIKFSEIPDAEYDLEIIKDGYARYTKHFKLQELFAELNHKPLSVTLAPALTLRVNDDHGYFALTSQSTTPWTVDWGDGIVNQPDSSEISGQFAFFFHQYPSTNERFISVTDASTVLAYVSIMPVTSANFDACVNLEEVNFFQGGLHVADLRQNSKLQMMLLYDVDTILLPKKNNLQHIKIHSALGSLNYIIDNVYSNAVRNNTQGGKIDFSTYYYDISEEESVIPLAIPNASSMAKLKILRDKYHWGIYPHLGTF